MKRKLIIIFLAGLALTMLSLLYKSDNPSPFLPPIIHIITYDEAPRTCVTALFYMYRGFPFPIIDMYGPGCTRGIWLSVTGFVSNLAIYTGVIAIIMKWKTKKAQTKQ